jgi:hypothetical protein
LRSSSFEAPLDLDGHRLSSRFRSGNFLSAAERRFKPWRMQRLQLFAHEQVSFAYGCPMAQIQRIARACPLPDRQGMSPEHAQSLSSKRLEDGVRAVAREVTLSLSPARSPLLLATSLISSALHLHHTPNGKSPISESAHWTNNVIWLDSAAGAAQNKTGLAASPCLIKTHPSQLVPVRCACIAQHRGPLCGIKMLACLKCWSPGAGPLRLLDNIFT